MVLVRKSCPFKLNCHCEVTPNCLVVKLTSASNQELEIVFVYNPNKEIDKIIPRLNVEMPYLYDV